MTELEYNVFSYIRANEPVSWVEILNAFSSDSNYREVEAVLNFALRNGVIEKTWKIESPPLCKVLLTDEGKINLVAENEHRKADALIREENIRREEEQERKRLQQSAADWNNQQAEKRADRKFQIALTLINAIFSFLLGLTAEHFLGLMDWLRMPIHDLINWFSSLG